MNKLIKTNFNSVSSFLFPNCALTTFNPYLLLWLQQVVPNMGLQSEGSLRAKLKLKYRCRVLKNSGMRSWKSPIALSNTLSGIETGVKHGKFRKLRMIAAIYLLLKAGFKNGGEGAKKENKWGPAIGTFTNRWETLLMVPFSRYFRLYCIAIFCFYSFPMA